MLASFAAGTSVTYTQFCHAYQHQLDRPIVVHSTAIYLWSDVQVDGRVTACTTLSAKTAELVHCT